MAYFPIPDAILFEFGTFLRNSTRVWPTDQPTDGRTDRRTDTPSYRDARTHLKKKENKNRTLVIFPREVIHPWRRKSEWTLRGVSVRGRLWALRGVSLPGHFLIFARHIAKLSGFTTCVSRLLSSFCRPPRASSSSSLAPFLYLRLGWLSLMIYISPLSALTKILITPT